MAKTDLVNVASNASPSSFNRFFTECIGSCHAYLTLREDFREHVRQVQREIGFKRIRCHGIFHDLVGVVHSETPGVAGGDSAERTGQLRKIYNFSNVDAIYDFFLSVGLQPYVELSFMPESLASSQQRIFRYQANISPPADMDEWVDLVSAFVDHLIDRYGIEEVQQWYFEVWNEPDLKDVFWTGTQQDYFELYGHTANAIKAIHPDLKVGGPSTSKNLWIDEFLAYCSAANAPVDFVSTHHYCADASLETGQTLFDIAWRGQAALREDALTVRRQVHESAFKNLEVHYTEWNVSPCHEDRFGKDSEFNAVFVLQTLKDLNGVSDVYSYWTISDIFEESGPGLLPFSGKYGLVNRHGLPKPVFHAYRFLSQMFDQALPVDDDGWVTRSENGDLRALFWNYCDALSTDFNGGDYELDTHSISQEITINGVSGQYRIRAYRVGRDHGNAYRAWQSIGSPQYPTETQLEHLRRKAQPTQIIDRIDAVDGELSLAHELEPCELIYYDISRIPR